MTPATDAEIAELRSDMGQCQGCHGTGEGMNHPDRDPDPCDVCDGTGRVMRAGHHTIARLLARLEAAERDAAELRAIVAKQAEEIYASRSTCGRCGRHITPEKCLIRPEDCQCEVEADALRATNADLAAEGAKDRAHYAESLEDVQALTSRLEAAERDRDGAIAQRDRVVRALNEAGAEMGQIMGELLPLRAAGDALADAVTQVEAHFGDPLNVLRDALAAWRKARGT